MATDTLGSMLQLRIPFHIPSPPAYKEESKGQSNHQKRLLLLFRETQPVFLFAPGLRAAMPLPSCRREPAQRHVNLDWESPGSPKSFIQPLLFACRLPSATVINAVMCPRECEKRKQEEKRRIIHQASRLFMTVYLA